ncbi:MAG: methylenetetrahydrofolate--tRNA-(uracil(54)-C(5))-methyltransferase (FADH(2)-oxidizing) TrmFO [Deltaproteobacteria bacterium CG12_big_fil_rev_8_21_14_0_65_43_10]|nr:MAG: methylenetetrahydrofolate--tRNA-(uracil(54)-C(5))-methyltransferase (FADH(2)-oxidizing) TrmFO [Deltaproteobacteria bacterium CG2_30_43_15]PIQ45856.1 MAG: methylenetetrahydrofolate--tRNA-(uracil(54)-C(5))-methyltransferase (FADH(2)-oxidizing) TrmFO [Deltaproteobacteria bacterium CG12_big_fil_rev_8_21_14_0_65_43_10]PIU86038.1 MAG: methylenetetrahydrofolate--tRNA-(uracil(54)-C(5))-methyltransferase (FADH(2)-oxidizing) TrmFO [Deltaproteobacteria bacterium CG06_land_8_20_14_3_00_44_19]PIX2587
MNPDKLIIIGGGLAGCEAAWQAAKRGIDVILYEMKPKRFSPAHLSDDLAELVCSNSLRSSSLENASGLIKEEMRRMDSLIIRAADETRVPAGSALAVDRQGFSRFITQVLEEMDNVEIIREEVTKIPEDTLTIVATGPLTSETLGDEVKKLIGENYLYFYDAIAPIVEADSINFDIAYRSSRYGKGGNDYINCPMTKEDYYKFIDALMEAEKTPTRNFEKMVPFEGCMPIEETAERGKDTLLFGPMKPVGLANPGTGEIPYAVVQLRQDNSYGTLYNMVGFQTKLRWNEQKRIFRMIPGLEQAEFARLGSLHRNTFINSRRLLNNSLQLRKNPSVFFAGQITGVEGYVESSAMGLLAGINASRLTRKLPLIPPPLTTAIGALVGYITETSDRDFQPMNINFGLLPPTQEKVKKELKRKRIAEKALADLEEWKRDLAE